MSLPVRERGLKHNSKARLMRTTKSLPVRERGLKRDVIEPLVKVAGRSPCGSVD